MNWTPLIAPLIAPFAMHLVGRMLDGPEAALRRRLLDDVAIRDSLPDGAEKSAYAGAVVVDARKLLNLRGVLNAQRSCTQLLCVASIGTIYLVLCVLLLPPAMKVPSAIGALVYLAGAVWLARGRGRIGRIRQGIEQLEDPSRWIWRHALLSPWWLPEGKIERLVRSAEDLIQSRVERI